MGHEGRPGGEEPVTGGERSARNALLAGFLGWTLDAFDFFILAFVLAPVAAEFKVPVSSVA
ncbi:MAG TPA: MFS transporter, partial [Terriglobia bacterium]|nr:MFS transporter [Terriglobia bacterium]